MAANGVPEDEVVATYLRFARDEARSSPVYERLARAVAADDHARGWLAQMDDRRRQPNLLFAAMRWHGAPVEDPPAALAWLTAHREQVKVTSDHRSTQTNEVARCALLLPALARLPPPLALIDVGASAGLGLLYDAWGYHYTGAGVDHHVGDPSRLVLTCVVNDDVPLPVEVPSIRWRCGLDLNPLDAGDPDARRWLETLVWPEHHERRRRLCRALAVAEARRPPLRRGDLADLPALLAEVPTGATPVVTHAATLAYVDAHRRSEFVRRLSADGVHRLGLEAPGVVPGTAVDVPRGEFVVTLDDAVLATAAPHGGRLRWR